MLGLLASRVELRMSMRHLLIAIVAALVLSGCKTSGYNPVKIEAEESWHQVPSVARLLSKLFEVLEP
jgi:outer membrane biogenesis lipoprotein LolB